MPAEEDVIALVVQRYHLPALELRLRGEHGSEKVRCEKAERGAEVVEDEFGRVVRRVAVSGEAFSFDPVADGEVEHGAVGEMDEVDARGAFLVFL